MPDALQRTSDEAWVSLCAPVPQEPGRWRADLAGRPDRMAVVHSRPPGGLKASPHAYGEGVAKLMALGGPQLPRGVVARWPVDLLHDLDGIVVGYIHRATPHGALVEVAQLADPAIRGRVAPAATWQHRLRAGRHAAEAVGALHLAGCGLGQARLWLDDRSRLTLDDCDRLLPSAAEALLVRERRELGGLLARLVDGGAGAAAGDAVARACRAAHTADPPYLGQWVTALRAAERDLVTCPAEPLHVHAAALEACPWCPPPVSQPASRQVRQRGVSPRREPARDLGRGHVRVIPAGSGSPTASTPRGE